MLIRFFKQWRFVVIMIFAAVLLCQVDLQNPVSGRCQEAKDASVKGSIRVSGAWALYPMMVKWAEEFKKVHPGVRIDISAGGAGKGVADALSGMVDIGMVSRDLRPEEIRQQVFYVPVVKDAVFPTVNAANPVMHEIAGKGLTKKSLEALWVSGSKFTWGDLTGTQNKNPVRVYTRSDSCGAAEIWAKYLGVHQEDLKGVAVYGDPGLAEAVRRDKTGIGYNNLNYAFDLTTGAPVPGIQILPVDINENGRIDPEEQLRTKEEAVRAVLAGVYPSPPARDIYLVGKSNFRGAAKVFVHWILTDGQRYVDEVGYLKVRPVQIREALERMGK